MCKLARPLYWRFFRRGRRFWDVFAAEVDARDLDREQVGVVGDGGGGGGGSSPRISQSRSEISANAASTAVANGVSSAHVIVFIIQWKEKEKPNPLIVFNDLSQYHY